MQLLSFAEDSPSRAFILSLSRPDLPSSGDGTKGSNLMFGNAGRDDFAGLGGVDILLGEVGDDLLYGSDGDDHVGGGIGNDYLGGDAGADTLLGGEGADRLTSGSGNDTLTGGLGNDQLDGGVGADTYHFRRGDGMDRITDSGDAGSTDRLIFEAGVAAEELWLSRVSNDLVLRLGATDTVTISRWFDGAHRQIEQVCTAQQMIGAPAIDALVQAMAAFGGPPAGGMLGLGESEREALSAVIAANWQARV